MNRKQEIKEYKAMLKRNEDEIARLNGINKHIKAHVKFLEGLDEFDGDVLATTLTGTVTPVEVLE